MLHEHIALSIGAFVMIATGTMLITYFQYLCGMFSITW